MVNLRMYDFNLVHEFSWSFNLEVRMYINMTAWLKVYFVKVAPTTLREVAQGCSSKFLTIAGALLVEGSEELKPYMQNL